MDKVILCFVLFLSACGSMEQVVVQKVEVPIVSCPAPEETVRPALPIDELKKGDNPAAVVKAYKATVKALEGYVEQLETILDGYRHQEIK